MKDKLDAQRIHISKTQHYLIANSCRVSRIYVPVPSGASTGAIFGDKKNQLVNPGITVLTVLTDEPVQVAVTAPHDDVSPFSFFGIHGLRFPDGIRRRPPSRAHRTVEDLPRKPVGQGSNIGSPSSWRDDQVEPGNRTSKEQAKARVKIIRTPLIATLLILSIASSSKAQTPPATYMLQMHVKVPMRDGIHLDATVYRPVKDSGPLPIIMMLTPYPDFIGHPSGAYFAAHGYIYASVDVRGRGDSEGIFDPFAHDANDGYYTV